MLKEKQHAASAQDVFAEDVISGLSAAPRSLSSKWLYDTAGSAIFEEITQVKDYYLTRTEAAIFENILPELAVLFKPGSGIVEFGSGASIKTRNLLSALQPACYVPMDIADEFLQSAAEDLHQLFPDIEIMPIVADLTAPYQLPQAFLDKHSKLGFFPGSTIGNFTAEIARRFLTHTREAMGSGAHLLISADLVKDKNILVRAYDDHEGVTPRFTLNLLTRMNRELGGNFDLSSFRHVAEFNEQMSRIEIHIESIADQIVTVAGKDFRFGRGDRIRTEYSYKYSESSFSDLLEEAGWRLERFWSDPNDWFGVFLAVC